MADYYQLAHYTLSELRLPYYRLPRAYFDREQSFDRWFTAGVNTEAARFQHLHGPARPRRTPLDLNPYVRMTLGRPSCSSTGDTLVGNDRPCTIIYGWHHE